MREKNLLYSRWIITWGKNILVNNEYFFVILMLIIGGFIRFWGNGFGLPYLYHPDEGALVMPALKILHTGNFNPGRFDYGSFYIYTLFLAYIPFFLFGVKSGYFSRVQDIPYYENIMGLTTYEYPGVYVIGRSISALFGLAIIPLAYILARKLFGKKTAIISCLLISFFPPLVENSHYATTDSIVTFLFLLVIFLSLKLYKVGSLKFYILTGLTIGIAISTKYAFSTIITLIVAHIIRNGFSRNLWNLDLICSALLSIIAGFFLGTPFAIFDFTNFMNYLARLVQIYNRPDVLQPIVSTPIWWIKYICTLEAAPFIIIALTGLFFLLVRRTKETIIVFSSSFFYWILILTQTTRYPRLWLPTIPVFAVLAGYGLNLISSKITEKFKILNKNAVIIVFVLFLVGNWSITNIKADWHLTQKDIRTETVEWAIEHLPEKSKIALDSGGPPISNSRWNTQQMVRVGYYPLEWYKNNQFDYLIISQPMREEMNITKVYENNYKSIEDGAKPLKKITGSFLNLAEQYIIIYQVPE